MTDVFISTEVMTALTARFIVPMTMSAGLRRKMIYLYSDGRMDEFCGMLDEAAQYGLLDGVSLEGRPGHRSENAALILSVLPGAGLAYAGDWGNAIKYFLVDGSIIALGVGAFSSGLYAATFMGGGMLLYSGIHSGHSPSSSFLKFCLPFSIDTPDSS